MHSTLGRRESDQLIHLFASAIAAEVAALVMKDLAPPAATIAPRLFDVNQAALYLGRSEQSVQHLILQKALPVVRIGRRVHLDRHDLDQWIETNKY